MTETSSMLWVFENINWNTCPPVSISIPRLNASEFDEFSTLFKFAKYSKFNAVRLLIL